MTGSPPMVLPSAMAQAVLGLVEIGARPAVRADRRSRGRVGQFDADGVAARHHGDAGRDRRHRAGDVVGQPDHARGLDPRRGFQFVQRHDRAGMDLDDLAVHAEILQRLFERVGIDLQLVFRLFLEGLDRRPGQSLDRKRLVMRRVEFEPFEETACGRLDPLEGLAGLDKLRRFGGTGGFGRGFDRRGDRLTRSRIFAGFSDSTATGAGASGAGTAGWVGPGGPPAPARGCRQSRR